MSDKPYYTPFGHDDLPFADAETKKSRESSWILIALIVICLHALLPWLGTWVHTPTKKPPPQKLLVQTVRLPPSSAQLISQAEKPIVHQPSPEKSAPKPLNPPAEPPTPPLPPPPEPQPVPSPPPPPPEPVAALPKEETKPLAVQKEEPKATPAPSQPKRETPASHIAPKPVPKKTTPPPKPAPTPVKKAAPVTKPVAKAPDKKSEESKAKLAAQEAEKKKQQEIKAAQEAEKKQKEQKEREAKEAERKRRLEMEAEAERKRQEELAAREAARKQALLAKAQESLAKNKESRGKDLSTSASALNLQNTAIPTMIGSLQIDALPLESEGLAKWTATEVSYRDEVAQILQGALRLPEYGSIKIELTISKTGKVEKVKILSSENSKNRQYIEQKVPGLPFPSFGNRFKESAKCTFSITLNNERTAA